jgi:hypothetical protein
LAWQRQRTDRRYGGGRTLDRYRAREHDIYLGAWAPDYPDPNTNAGTFNPDNSDEAGATGLLAWRNAWAIPEMSEKTLVAMVENDTETRAEMYRELQREHQQTSPFGVMFQQIEQNGMQSSVENLVAGGATTAKKIDLASGLGAVRVHCRSEWHIRVHTYLDLSLLDKPLSCRIALIRSLSTSKRKFALELKKWCLSCHFAEDLEQLLRSN